MHLDSLSNLQLQSNQSAYIIQYFEDSKHENNLLPYNAILYVWIYPLKLRMLLTHLDFIMILLFPILCLEY